MHSSHHELKISSKFHLQLLFFFVVVVVVVAVAVFFFCFFFVSENNDKNDHPDKHYWLYSALMSML